MSLDDFKDKIEYKNPSVYSDGEDNVEDEDEAGDDDEGVSDDWSARWNTASAGSRPAVRYWNQANIDQADDRPERQS